MGLSRVVSLAVGLCLLRVLAVGASDPLARREDGGLSALLRRARTRGRPSGRADADRGVATVVTAWTVCPKFSGRTAADHCAADHAGGAI